LWLTPVSADGRIAHLFLIWRENCCGIYGTGCGLDAISLTSLCGSVLFWQHLPETQNFPVSKRNINTEKEIKTSEFQFRKETWTHNL
jgi:hypothetical protein